MTIGGFQTTTAHSGAAAPAAVVPAVTAADQVKIRAAMEKLSPEDRKLAEAQFLCAIDWDNPLGTMGPIYYVMAKGTPVFLCCKGCESQAKANPDEALQMLQKLMSRSGVRR